MVHCSLDLLTTLSQTSSRGWEVDLGRTVPAAVQTLNKDKNIQPRGWLLLFPKFLLPS